MRWQYVVALVGLGLLAATTGEQYGTASWRILKVLITDMGCISGGPCDLAAGTTVNGASITGPADNLGNHTATATLDMAGYPVTNTGDLGIEGNIVQRPSVNTTTAVHPERVPDNDVESWFNIDGQASPVEGEGGGILKTTAIGIEHLVVSLTETETFHTLSTLILGGDGDGVVIGADAYCTGGSHASGNEGCQSFRSRVNDVWLTAFGTFSDNIASGAGTVTATITAGTITEAETKMLGENKLIVFTASPVSVAITDAPPGTINGGVLEDAGTAWSFDGSATGQGVFTLGAGQVTSSGVQAGSWCIAPVDSNYTDISSQASHLWLLIDQINSGTDTVRTRWENQGYNGKTPFPLLVGEHPSNTEALLAPCAVLGPPTLNAGDYVADSLTLVKGANFPAISSGASSAFEVAAYPGSAQTSFRALLSNRLGRMYPGAGFKALNQLDGGAQSGRFQSGAAFDPDVSGSLSNLLDGEIAGWHSGLGCDTAGECEIGVEYVYASDPTPISTDQWFAQVDWPSADWLDDIDRIVIRAADDSTKNLTLDKTDGWGANGDAFLRESQVTSGTATPTDGSTACNTRDTYLETDVQKFYVCTDGATDKWYGVQLVDTP